MSTQDKFGRQYLKITDAKVGMCCRCDGDFTCMRRFESTRLALDFEGGGYYFHCANGRHYLSSQDNGEGYAVGVYPI